MLVYWCDIMNEEDLRKRVRKGLENQKDLYSFSYGLLEGIVTTHRHTPEEKIERAKIAIKEIEKYKKEMKKDEKTAGETQ